MPAQPMVPVGVPPGSQGTSCGGQSQPHAAPRAWNILPAPSTACKFLLTQHAQPGGQTAQPGLAHSSETRTLTPSSLCQGWAAHL